MTTILHIDLLSHNVRRIEGARYSSFWYGADADTPFPDGRAYQDAGM